LLQIPKNVGRGLVNQTSWEPLVSSHQN